MKDFAWLDEIEAKDIICAEDTQKLIETVKVMREALECIERETDCPATQTTILNALEKCK